MPSELQKRQHGGVARIRTKKLRNGTTLRIYFYKDRKSYAEAMKRRRGGGKAK